MFSFSISSYASCHRSARHSCQVASISNCTSLTRRRWLRGGSDIRWFNPDGGEMTEEQWQTGSAKSLGVFLNGEAIPSLGPRGERILDDSFLLLFNAHHEPIEFRVPNGGLAPSWTLVLDTAALEEVEGARTIGAGEVVTVEGRAVTVLRRAA